MHVGVGGFLRSQEAYCTDQLMKIKSPSEWGICDVDNPLHPKLVSEYLTAALRKNRDNGLPAFTVQSRDNIQHNENLTRKMVLFYARQQDPELAEWNEREVCFPNAMVDRITPVTTESD